MIKVNSGISGFGNLLRGSILATRTPKNLCALISCRTDTCFFSKLRFSLVALRGFGLKSNDFIKRDCEISGFVEAPRFSKKLFHSLSTNLDLQDNDHTYPQYSKHWYQKYEMNQEILLVYYLSSKATTSLRVFPT